MRRAEKRMRELGIERYGNYLDHLQANAGEFTRLFDTILINVTSFFRDEETLVAEAMGVEELGRRVKIYATDVDDEALAEARRAEFSDRSVRSVPAEILERYFQPAGQRYAIMKELRRAVIFGRHNPATDAPISKIDLLLCRNTLMCLSAPPQSYILEGFHFALNPDGFMVLGKSEVMLTRTDRFLSI
jgi:two-component system, chemotaxis family, CheB/CheR fusion protein